ncbi:MAG: HAD family hydrolase [Anaeroplasmataceae bacterium]
MMKLTNDVLNRSIVGANTKWALFDFDGTIIDGSAVLGHCGFLIKKGIIRDDDGIYEAWQNDMKNEHKIMMCGEFYRKAIKGFYTEDLLIDEFVSLNHKYYEKVISKFHQLKEEGFVTVIISGSTNDLVQGFVKKLGFTMGFGAIYGKDTMGAYNGTIIKETYKSDIKAEIIKRLIDEDYCEEVIGFGDSTGDISICDVSDTFYLIDPSNEVRSVYDNMELEYTIITR